MQSYIYYLTIFTEYSALFYYFYSVYFKKTFFFNIYQAQSGKMKVEMQIRKGWFRIQVLSPPTK